MRAPNSVLSVRGKTDRYGRYKFYSILGKHYNLPMARMSSRTQEDILIESTVLFSLKGYSAVSMRDISSAIGIKSSSFYNHFKSKEALWIAILRHATKLYVIYIRQLDRSLAGETSIRRMLDIVFHEPKKMSNLYTCYSFSMIQRERVRDNLADTIFRRVFMDYATKILTRNFDRCTDLAPDVDTTTLAINCLCLAFYGIDMHVSSLVRNEQSPDFMSFYTGVVDLLVSGAKGR
ncbi:MAG: TetR/AcrR family transcriptional regulator [Desulfovibrio sp.]|jgi:AcrR family transcriptional regulator|nr:TetR/AcrR family transcriptional regulator [Desulfovibrio sp.]